MTATARTARTLANTASLEERATTWSRAEELGLLRLTARELEELAEEAPSAETRELAARAAARLQ